MLDETIYIDKIDEINLKIQCNREQSHELYDRFSCYTENYKYHPRYKSGIWNGKISFFDFKNQLLPIGLILDFLKFCKEFNYKYKFSFDIQELYNKITDEDFNNFYKTIFKNSEIKPRDYQDEAIKRALRNKRGVIELPTGCHSKGTKILMFNGTLKKVEDIQINDKLMGPDNVERNVIKTLSGNEQMYKITPNKGNSFIVNENHILHLKFTTGGQYYKKYKNGEINISVKDYLQKNKTFKHEAKLIYNSKELIFNNKLKNNTKLNPYFIGLYLGDGHVHNCAITTMDGECVKEIYKQSELYENCEIRVKEKEKNKAKQYSLVGYRGIYNVIFQDFKKIGLNFGFSKKIKKLKCETKFIPDVIKYGSIKDRLEVLAGIIDSNGTLSNGTYYDIIMKSEKMIKDISFVAKSLGLFVPKIKKKNINNVDYYRCRILGNIDKIPVRIKRKKQFKIRNINKSIFVHSFKIEKKSIDKFYGFKLNNDHLYMTEDFMIHHNSGKSLCIYSIIRFLLGLKKNILLVVPSIGLTNQMFSDFNDYGFNNAELFTSILYSQSKKYDKDKLILISTWQSIYKKQKQFFENFDAIIVDETHIGTSEGKSVQSVLKKCSNAEYRIGFTGTLPESLIHKFTLFGYIGPKIYSKKSKELINDGYLSNIKIANIILKYPNIIIDKNKNRPYAEEIRTIVDYDDRNKIFSYIINKIKFDNNILILCRLKEHQKKIYKYLKDNIKNRNIYFIDGNTQAEEREYIRNQMEKESGTILLATYGTTSTGINIKKIHHIIFASSYKAKIKVIQSIGRGLRKHVTKDKLILWDLIDNLCFIKRTGNIGMNYVYKHFLMRLKYYKDQEFLFINHNVCIEKL